MNESGSLGRLLPLSPGSRTDRRRPVTAGLVALLLIAFVLVVSGCGGANVPSPSQPSLPAMNESSSSSSVIAQGGSLDTASTESLDTASTTITGSYHTVTVEDLASALASDPTAQLVDVREPAEWADTGVIAEALLISLGDLETRAPPELDGRRPVYVICRSGNRSRVGAETLVRLGFEQVYNVSGGMAAWIQAGFPVVPYGG